MTGKIRLTLAALALAALTGCSTVQTGTLNVPTWDYIHAGVSSFKLDVSPDSNIDGGSAAGYAVTTKDYGKDVVVSVNAVGASGLKALYFNLAYDPAQYRPLTAEPTTAMASKSNLLNLTVMTQPGKVIYGQVIANYGWRTGYTGSATLAQVMFRKEPFPAQRAVSAAGAPPTNAASASVLTYDGANHLAWDYANRGDYNQDKLDSINDLTPLGAKLGQGTGGGPFPRADVKSQIDGNSDGLLSINDLTPLGSGISANAQIDGYNVYGTATAADVPTDNTTASPAGDKVGTVLFAGSDNAANKNTQRLLFHFDLTAGSPTNYYWVRPFVGSAEGAHSNVIAPAGVAPNLTLNNPPVTGDGSAGNPYVVAVSDTYTFTVTDPTNGNADVTASSTITSDDMTHYPVAGNTLTVNSGGSGNFSVRAEFPVASGIFSATLSFSVGAVTGGLFIMKDPADVNWNGVPNVGDATAGQSTDPYVMHDSTFNPDGDADGIYDLPFGLVANTAADGSGTAIPDDTLTWDSFPPFVALDIDTPTKGTFHVNQFSVGYVFANDGTTDSNHLYVQVSLDQT